MSTTLPHRQSTGVDFSRYITIFTDASHCPDTGSAGWAFWVKFNIPEKEDPVTYRSSGDAVCVNSTKAEELAISKAATWVRHNIDLTDKIIVLQSDCVAALNSFDDSRLMGAGSTTRVKKKHVKGHRGTRDKRSSVNTWCDKAARACMNRKRKELESSAREEG